MISPELARINNQLYLLGKKEELIKSIDDTLTMKIHLDSCIEFELLGDDNVKFWFNELQKLYVEAGWDVTSAQFTPSFYKLYFGVRST